jgi:hypothetical protein
LLLRSRSSLNFFAGPRYAAKALRPIKSRPLRKISGKDDTTLSKQAHRPIAAPISYSTMSAPASRALRRCICTARPAAYARPTIGATQQRIQRRWASGDANPKIATIVDQISQLTLLETADLVSTLKVGLLLAVGGGSGNRSACVWSTGTPKAAHATG